MLKSRWFWIAIAGFAILAISPPVAYRLWWYPHTLRGKFDRVHLGMPKAEVMQILGKPGTFYTQWPAPVVFVEEWWFEKGQVRYTKCAGGGLTFPFAIEEVGGIPLFPPTWGYDEAQIMVRFNNENQVCYKSWSQYSDLSSFWEQIRQWLPLP